MEDEGDNAHPLLKNELVHTLPFPRGPYTPRQSFVSPPSFNSFHTSEFFPPDLSKFSTNKYRTESSQPTCMTSAWRVISFFIVVFVFPTLLISIPLYARYHLYHAKAIVLTDGDMNSFHKEVSTFWCQGQKITSNGTFDAYLTKEVRRVRGKARVTRLSSDLLLTYDDIEHWGVHLIQGSRFTFNACARWPGGTLIVVQGKENLRRCFYREERFLDLLTNTDDPPNPKHHPFYDIADHDSPKERENVGSWEESMKKEKFFKENTKDFEDIRDNEEFMQTFKKETEEDIGKGELLKGIDIEDLNNAKGGEEFDSGEDFQKTEIIRQLYSSHRKSLETNKQQTSSEEHLKSTTNGQLEATTEKELILSKDEFLKKPNKIKNKTVQPLKKIAVKSSLNIKNQTKTLGNDDVLVTKKSKRDTRSLPDGFDTGKMGAVATGKGSLFFNINDTIDVTTGNSSFSSSEEFLRQCSNTIITIDLLASPECSHMASLESPNKTIQWSFRANSTDYYYFIFSSDNSIEANVISFKLLIERRLYNVSNHLQKCSRSNECVFPFAFMKSEGVIVDFNERYENISRLEDLNNYEILAICQPRSVVYTVFILLVPFIIMLFAFR